MRAIGLTLLATKNLIEEFGIDLGANLADLVGRYQAMQQRDEETVALAVPTVPNAATPVDNSARFSGPNGH